MLGVAEHPLGDDRGLGFGEALRPIDRGQLGLLLGGHRLELGLLQLDLALEELALRLHRHVFAGRHRERARE